MPGLLPLLPFSRFTPPWRELKKRIPYPGRHGASPTSRLPRAWAKHASRRLARNAKNPHAGTAQAGGGGWFQALRRRRRARSGAVTRHDVER